MPPFGIPHACSVRVGRGAPELGDLALKPVESACCRSQGHTVAPPTPASQAEHSRQTRDAYDRPAAVWAATTDDGPFNGLLERPALQSLVPAGLAGAVVLDAGCGSGAGGQ
jgi:hypothetical protein